MKINLSATAFVLLLAGGMLWAYSSNSNNNNTPTANNSTEALAINSNTNLETVNWMSWEEAMVKMESNPKKVLVDVYTNWCGWCKRMDATTFKDPEVVNYVNTNFYAVKLNAEQREDITYDNHVFKFSTNKGKKVHELAASILDNRLSYPSIVYFNEKMERVLLSAGYKDGPTILSELQKVNK